MWFMSKVLKTGFVVLLLCALSEVFAATIEGEVHDSKTGEPLAGAAVRVVNTDLFASTKLDGTYTINNVPEGTHEVFAEYMFYEDSEHKTVTIKEDEEVTLNFLLGQSTEKLDEVKVRVKANRGSKLGARLNEKNADNVVNVISSNAIEVSPDITVANVVQRVSGLTVERNSNGDGQYAIVRGMDKRYNYTLVNGIKIPSPDNENRYVPLDIFPSELLEQLEVTKSLTPSMEGDAIGGVVNMKMKDAPEKRLFKASLSTGYSEIFFNRPYDNFNAKAVDHTTPIERSGGRVAPLEYYSTENMNFEKVQPLPSIFASASWGDRFLDDKLGVIVSGSFQNSYRGADRREFGISEIERNSNRPRVSKVQDRRYSTQQQRSGLHNKLDYRINKKHRLSLYNVWAHLTNNETRTIQENGLRSSSTPTLEYNWRPQVNIQRIYNSTLQGEHQLSPKISADWSLVYSHAKQKIPDNSQIVTVSNYDTGELRYLVHENLIRMWESNTDRDYASYYNMTFIPTIGEQDFEIKAGGLARIKDRKNNFEQYTFKPNPGRQEYIPYETDYADITWRITNAAGTPTHVLNFESYENIVANYAQVKFIRWNTQFLGGVRAEHTDQGYVTNNEDYPEGGQQYWSILPSAHIKYMPNKKMNIRGSYFKSLSRPSFLEIIPFRRPSTEEIVARAGNPDLMTTTAHNFDARFEYYPKGVDQILVGAFYKIIQDPIEWAIRPPSDVNTLISSTFMPLNFPTAYNQGIELDVSKYIGKFGIRANYTFTLSEIRSEKRTWTVITDDNYDELSDLQKEELDVGDSTFMNVTQIRPLQGQSRHLANISLLYKDSDRGLNAQLSTVFTGERIAIVSTGYETDFWQKPQWQFDFSFEKRFLKKWVAFCKINNLLNSPYEVYIKKPHVPRERINAMQPNSSSETLVRYDEYQRTYMLGIKLDL